MSVARIAAVLVVVLALAGCGGGDDNEAVSWADDVCSSLDAWVGDVDSAVKSLSDEGLNLDEDDVQNAVGDAVSATDQLVDELRDLEPPETEASETAQREVNALLTQLESQADVVQKAVDAGGPPLTLVATVAGAISTALTSLKVTFESLQKIDTGELADAFRDSEDCDALQERVDELRR